MTDERAKMKAEILAEIQDEKRRYKAEWRKNNPDKVKAANERYYLKKANEIMRRGEQNEE